MLAAIPSPTIAIPTCRLKSFWTYSASWPHDTHVMTMFRSRMESFINTPTSALQRGHLTHSVRDGARATSPSQLLHLKCIIGLMRGFFVILLVAASVHA